MRQIKNGQTLFEKEVMQKRYNNPFLEIAHLKEELKSFIEHTSPKEEIDLTRTKRSHEKMGPGSPSATKFSPGGQSPASSIQQMINTSSKEIPFPEISLSVGTIQNEVGQAMSPNHSINVVNTKNLGFAANTSA